MYVTARFQIQPFLKQAAHFKTGQPALKRGSPIQSMAIFPTRFKTGQPVFKQVLNP